MSTIRASCSECGDLELSTAAVTVRTCLDTGKSTYSFRCTRCRMVIIKPAEIRTAELLVNSGVRLEEWYLPLELSEPRTGDPVDHDFLLDGHILLDNDDAFTAELERFALLG